jgi:hypothetical protein
MAAHSVGDQIQAEALVDQKRILIVFSTQTNVGLTPSLKGNDLLSLFRARLT